MTKILEIVNQIDAHGINADTAAVETAKHRGRLPITNDELMKRFNENPKKVNPAQRKRLIEAGLIEKTKRTGRKAVSNDELLKRFNEDPKSINPVQKKRLVEAGLVSGDRKYKESRSTDEIFKDFVLNGYDSLSLHYRKRLIDAGMIHLVPAKWEATAEHKNKIGGIRMAKINAEKKAAKAAMATREKDEPEAEQSEAA